MDRLNSTTDQIAATQEVTNQTIREHQSQMAKILSKMEIIEDLPQKFDELHLDHE